MRISDWSSDVCSSDLPLPQAELDKLNELVKQAMGYSAERGDTLSVVNSQFSHDGPPTLPIWENPVYLDYAMQLIQYLLIALVIYILWRSVVKPFMADSRSEEHTSELQSLMRTSYAAFCLKKKTKEHI